MKDFRDNMMAVRRGIHALLCLWAMLVGPTSLTGCSKDDKEEEQLEVWPENLELDDSGMSTLTITSNTKWSVSTIADWLSFSTMSGVGNGQVTVSATNTSSTDRMAIVAVKADGVVRQVEVTQKIKSNTTDGPSSPAQESVLTINVSGVSFKMIRVEGGTFWMGATAEQLGDATEREKPMHQVTLSSYYIGETEVTQQLWQAVTGQKPTSDGEQWDSRNGLGPSRPAYGISWNDCQEFITKLNALTGRTFRLPTEAEWEFAARGGMKSKGYKYAGSNIIDDVAWYEENSFDKGSSSPDYGAHDVATKQPNELGLYDMSGNVFELCSDYWIDEYDSSAQINPTGPTTGFFRVCRSSCWISEPAGCRVAFRSFAGPADRLSVGGFRLALQ